MKIILIRPNFLIKKTVGPPLGLGYIASCLEDAGHKVKIIDSIIEEYNLSGIKKELQSFNPDIVGISSNTHNINDALSIVKLAKNINPNCLTLLGGPHPSILPKQTLEKSPDLDVIIKGEGEKTFVELMQKNKKEGFPKIKGISYRSNNKIIENRGRGLIKNLDSIPFPAYHLLPMEKYKVKFFDLAMFGKKGKLFGTIYTSRGCPYNCAFCLSKKLWGSNIRNRSPGNVIDELKILRYKYNRQIIDFLDELFTFDKKRAEKICKMIKGEDMDLLWSCTTRVDLFSKDIAMALKNAGCFMVYFGIESGSQKTLDYLAKGFNITQVERAVKNANQVGLNVGGSFVLGSPGETKEDITQTVKFAKKLNLRYAGFSLLKPFPGTKIFETLEKKHIKFEKNWDKYNWYEPVIELSDLNFDELKYFRMNASLSFYVRPNFFFKILRSIIE